MNNITRISWYWHTIFSILAFLLCILLLEFTVRFLYPEINYQGNQRSMFVERKFHRTFGLKANSSGEFFGKQITTDEHGFRRMNTPISYDKSWVFLGDSVAFGLGVETNAIFPQLIQDKIPNTRIWNTAVVGYSALDYLNVVEDFVRKHNDVERIVLFFCLNDVYGNLSLNTAPSTRERILSFLRTNSKLYILLKDVFFDRSKAYALHDIKYYEDLDPGSNKHLNAIVNLKAITNKYSIGFLVVILPYEYQLRVRGLRSPQTLLKNLFQANNIQFIDLYEDFSSRDSKDYFLYGDPMHFSIVGHRVVADKLIHQLKNDVREYQ